MELDAKLQDGFVAFSNKRKKEDAEAGKHLKPKEADRVYGEEWRALSAEAKAEFTASVEAETGQVADRKGIGLNENINSLDVDGSNATPEAQQKFMEIVHSQDRDFPQYLMIEGASQYWEKVNST